MSLHRVAPSRSFFSGRRESLHSLPFSLFCFLFPFLSLLFLFPFPLSFSFSCFLSPLLFLSSGTRRFATQYTMTENPCDANLYELGNSDHERKSIGPFNPLLCERAIMEKKNAANGRPNGVSSFIVYRLIVGRFFIKEMYYTRSLSLSCAHQKLREP